MRKIAPHLRRPNLFSGCFIIISCRSSCDMVNVAPGSLMCAIQYVSVSFGVPSKISTEPIPLAIIPSKAIPHSTHQIIFIPRYNLIQLDVIRLIGGNSFNSPPRYTPANRSVHSSIHQLAGIAELLSNELIISMTKAGIGLAHVIVEQRHSDCESFFTQLIESTDTEGRWIWRGQANAEWKLEPSLVRLLSDQVGKPFYTTGYAQFKYFQEAARGRLNGNPPEENNKDEWLALGQHYGLATPLLDWTYAPFIALYFAFIEPSDAKERAVFALNTEELQELYLNERIEEDDRIRLINSSSHLNPRVINQRGLFTFCPLPYSIEEWLQQKAIRHKKTILVKHILPNTSRDSVLRTLNRMNINPLTLFPDLTGSAQYVNLKCTIPRY
jgi:hypothetical protein